MLEMILKHSFKYFLNVRDDTIVQGNIDVDNFELMSSLRHMKFV